MLGMGAFTSMSTVHARGNIKDDILGLVGRLRETLLASTGHQCLSGSIRRPFKGADIRGLQLQEALRGRCDRANACKATGDVESHQRHSVAVLQVQALTKRRHGQPIHNMLVRRCHLLAALLIHRGVPAARNSQLESTVPSKGGQANLTCAQVHDSVEITNGEKDDDSLNNNDHASDSVSKSGKDGLGVSDLAPLGDAMCCDGDDVA